MVTPLYKMLAFISAREHIRDKNRLSVALKAINIASGVCINKTKSRGFTTSLPTQDGSPEWPKKVVVVLFFTFLVNTIFTEDSCAVKQLPTISSISTEALPRGDGSVPQW